MKNKKYISFLAALFTTSFLSIEVSAQNFTISSFHSSICEAINPAQSQRMEWREDGLVNRDPNRSLWVMCPVPLEFFDTQGQQYSYFVLVAYNYQSQPVQLTCILRFYVNQNLRSHSQTMNLNANGGRAQFEWDRQNQELAGPSIACNLPPDAAISGLISGSEPY